MLHHLCALHLLPKVRSPSVTIYLAPSPLPTPDPCPLVNHHTVHCLLLSVPVSPIRSEARLNHPICIHMRLDPILMSKGEDSTPSVSPSMLLFTGSQVYPLKLTSPSLCFREASGDPAPVNATTGTQRRGDTPRKTFGIALELFLKIWTW